MEREGSVEHQVEMRSTGQFIEPRHVDSFKLSRVKKDQAKESKIEVL
jgi:hypothetical protein